MPHPLLIFRGGNAVADEKLEGIEPPALDELLALSAKDLHRIGGIVQDIECLPKRERNRSSIPIRLPQLQHGVEDLRRAQALDIFNAPKTARAGQASFFLGESLKLQFWRKRPGFPRWNSHKGRYCSRLVSCASPSPRSSSGAGRRSHPKIADFS